MKITVLTFAAARERFGNSSVELAMPDNSTLADLKKKLKADFPECVELIRRSAFSVDQQYAIDSTQLTEDSEIAIIPPVSGG